jgi:hypothetical protein
VIEFLIRRLPKFNVLAEAPLKDSWLSEIAYARGDKENSTLVWRLGDIQSE